MSDFSSLPLSPLLRDTLGALGYAEPTPIQARCIPVLVEGNDLIGQSKTGSGKTLAFVLPILQRLDVEQRQIQALVLCPTRELSAQVAGEFRKVGRGYPGLRVVQVCGGEPGFLQANTLARGAHIVVGTPGRILDHLHRESIDIEQVQVAVLDEADRMLDMGFGPAVEEILRALPTERQTILFSATFPENIMAISADFQRNPQHIAEDPEPPTKIRALAYTVEQADKTQALLWILAQHRPTSALIFCNLKRSVSELADTLGEAGLSVEGLHGDLEQRERDRAMAKLRNGSTRILVATDLAARGLDVAEIDVVINYDLPTQPEVYLHRTGRTGRAGREGLAINLLNPRQQGMLARIQEATGVEITSSPLTPTPLQVQDFVATMSTIFISGGRKDKLRPGDILGALTKDGGLPASAVGHIEIHDRFAYVAVQTTVIQQALQGLSRIKGRNFRVERIW